MNSADAADPAIRVRTWPAIFWAGLIAGTLDITDALVVTCYIRNGSATRLFQYIAQGLIGPDSFKGGMATAALGLALHYFIAYGAAAFFVAVSREVPALYRRPWIFGPIYGVGFYFFMNYVVLPLSATPPFNPLKLALPVVLNQLGIHALGIGLTIALCTQ